MIKMPRLLLRNTPYEKARLRPTSMAVTLNADDLSTVSLALSPQEQTVMVGDWLRVYTNQGDAGVFVIRTTDEDHVTGERTAEAEHAFGILMDDVAFGELTPQTMGGTETTVQAATAIRYLLSLQSEPIWQLGQCDYDIAQGWSFTDTNLYTALQTIKSGLPDAEWRFDMARMPFTVNLKHKPVTHSCEMRMSRNISTMHQTIDKSGMITRLYAVGHDGITLPDGGYMEKNTDVWGVISSIRREDSCTTVEELTAWAQKQLDVLAVPRVSITIGGLELSAATGERFDKLVPGTVCHVPIAGQNVNITQRIVSITWPDIIFSEENVTVTMANSRETLTNAIMRMESQMVSDMIDLENFKLDLSPIVNDFNQSGGYSSVKNTITTLEQTRIGPLETASARFKVTADAIDSEVSKYHYDSAGALLEAWGSNITQAAGVIQSGVFEGFFDGQGNLIKSISSMITQTASDIRLEVVGKDELNSLVDISGSGVTIQGGTITLNGAVIFDTIEGYIDSHLSTGTLGVGTITGGTADFDDVIAGTLNGINVYLCTMTVGETEVGQFFGPADISFELSDLPGFDDALREARSEGASSVTVKDLDVYDEEYGRTTKTISANVDVILSTNATHQVSISVDASDAYKAGESAGWSNGYWDGEDSVYVRSISVTDETVRGSKVEVTLDVDLSSGNSSSHVISVDAGGGGEDNVTCDSVDFAYEAGGLYVMVNLSNGKSQLKRVIGW